MPDSPDVFDDGHLGPARPLTEHEQRRLNDIAAWLDLTDAGFGARMRRRSPRPRRPTPPPNRGHTPPRADPATSNVSERHPTDPAGPTSVSGPDGPGGPMAERGWNALVQVVAGFAVLLILLSVSASGPWAVLAVSVLFTVVPVLLIAIYVLRLPGDPGH